MTDDPGISYSVPAQAVRDLQERLDAATARADAAERRVELERINNLFVRAGGRLLLDHDTGYYVEESWELIRIALNKARKERP